MEKGPAESAKVVLFGSPTRYRLCAKHSWGTKVVAFTLLSVHTPLVVESSDQPPALSVHFQSRSHSAPTQLLLPLSLLWLSPSSPRPTYSTIPFNCEDTWRDPSQVAIFQDHGAGEAARFRHPTPRLSHRWNHYHHHPLHLSFSRAYKSLGYSLVGFSCIRV